MVILPNHLRADRQWPGNLKTPPCLLLLLLLKLPRSSNRMTGNQPIIKPTQSPTNNSPKFRGTFVYTLNKGGEKDCIFLLCVLIIGRAVEDSSLCQSQKFIVSTCLLITVTSSNHKTELCISDCFLSLFECKTCTQT